MGGFLAGTEHDHISDDVRRTHRLPNGVILPYAFLLFEPMSEIALWWLGIDIGLESPKQPATPYHR